MNKAFQEIEYKGYPDDTLTQRIQYKLNEMARRELEARWNAMTPEQQEYELELMDQRDWH